MIIGDLNRGTVDGRSLHPVLAEAVQYLQTTDFSKLDNGTHQLKGDLMFANVMAYNTRSESEVPFEKHEAYIDVQYVISGEEKIGWFSHDDAMTPDEDQLKEKDYALYHHAKASMYVPMTTGRYVILFPDDVHQPSVSESAGIPVRKVVVKIHMDLLK